MLSQTLILITAFCRSWPISQPRWYSNEVGEEEWGDAEEEPPYNDEWGDADEEPSYNDEAWGNADEVPPYGLRN